MDCICSAYAKKKKKKSLFRGKFKKEFGSTITLAGICIASKSDHFRCSYNFINIGKDSLVGSVFFPFPSLASIYLVP